MITAVISVKNESHQILDCIESVWLITKNILIIDDSSDDDTVRICKEHGCNVVTGEFSGNVELLNKQGFQLIRDGWILRLDADERLTQELADELRKISNQSTASGVNFARKNEMFGRLIEHGGWFESTQMRFFRADSWDREWAGFIHTHPEINGDVISLDKHRFHTIHLDYQNIRQFVQRSFHRYAYQEAEMLVKAGEDSSLLKMVYKPFKKTLGKYFVRKGFMDGQHGLILAILLGVYELLIQMYIWDLKKR